MDGRRKPMWGKERELVRAGIVPVHRQCRDGQAGAGVRLECKL